MVVQASSEGSTKDGDSAEQDPVEEPTTETDPVETAPGETEANDADTSDADTTDAGPVGENSTPNSSATGDEVDSSSDQVAEPSVQRPVWLPRWFPIDYFDWSFLHWLF